MHITKVFRVYKFFSRGVNERSGHIKLSNYQVMPYGITAPKVVVGATRAYVSS